MYSETGAADICTCSVQDKAAWESFVAAVIAAPDQELANEGFGGRTSDPCISTRYMVQGVDVSVDPEVVAAFLRVFPSGHFGRPVWGYVGQEAGVSVEGLHMWCNW